MKHSVEETLETKTKKQLEDRIKSYKGLFSKDNEFAKVVLDDLSKFCYANRSTYHTDPRMSDILIGRREVFLRLQKHAEIDEERLLSIAKKDPLSFDQLV